jgi:glycosyltransferase involved in cell wall biosynthesis
LDSAVHQTLPPEQYEVLVVDDGSTDATPDLVGEYTRSFANLRWIRNQQNLGLVASCNRGLAEAAGEYFIRLDADDTFLPEILESLSQPLASAETDFVYCDRYEVFMPEGRTIHVQVDPFNIYNLIAIGAMLRTELVREIGGYRPLFWEEFDLYIRYLLKSGLPPFYVPRPLFNYSNHPSSMTADPGAVANGWKELLGQWDLETLRRFGSHPVLEEIGTREGKVLS